MTTDPGRVGIWTAHLNGVAIGQVRDAAGEIEQLGYGALWLPEAVGRDPLVLAGVLLDDTQRLVLATGIANIYARDALATVSAHHTLAEAFPGRFLLGLGVGHQVAIEGLRGQTYGPPLATMRAYLDAMDAAPYPAVSPTTPPTRVLAALGPKMLALAAERTAGAHPYLAPVEHTAVARDVLGPERLLAPEQTAVLETDAAAARAIARGMLALYLTLPNYTNNLRRFGFTDDDFANGGSDRLVDAIVVWGDEEAIRARVQAQRDAGADHVCLQVLPPRGERLPAEAWRRLAPALV